MGRLEPEPAPSALVRYAAAIDDYPTVVQIDEMLAVLSGFPDSPEDTAISDRLLEMRLLLTQAETPDGMPSEAPAA